MGTEAILVVGGMGTLGAPVASQLRRDGRRVRLLVRDVGRARTRFGSDFTYCLGDIDDEAAIERALDGCAGVHLSVKGTGPADFDRVEHRGPARVAAVAARLGVPRLTYVSGYLVGADVAGTPADRAKHLAEEAIRRSGVPYTIFRPTYFMETLPLHVQGRVAVVLGRQPHPLHLTAADDFAGMVSRAYRTPEATNRVFYVQGPEALTIAAALRVYCALVAPGTRVLSVPLPIMTLVDARLMGGKLRNTLDLMRVIRQVGEIGDPSEGNRMLGAPSTTLREWCERRRAEPSGRDGAAP